MKRKNLWIMGMVLLTAAALLAGCPGGGGGGAPAAQTSVKLAQTGQTICYDALFNQTDCTGTGQDGGLQKGVAWPIPRFTNPDGTTPVTGSVVVDRLTGLMWLKDANCIHTRDAANTGLEFDHDGTTGDGAVTWQHALDFVAKINGGTYSTCEAGYTDWRLPNRKELRSIADYGESDSMTWLGAQGFTNVKQIYWSSTTVINNKVNAWALYANDGTEYYAGFAKSSTIFVWPVRGGQTSAVSLLQTGQKKCYDDTGATIACSGTGQDGASQEGVAWPNPRFTSNSDTTVIDNFTKLVWAPDAGTPTFTGSTSTCTGGVKMWDDDLAVPPVLPALDYVACLNVNNYLGHNDWRLPNVNEIESLVHAGYEEETCSGSPCATNADWLNTQGFGGTVKADEYWTSDTYIGEPGYAFIAFFSGGNTDFEAKNVGCYVWPVRGGE